MLYNIYKMLDYKQEIIKEMIKDDLFFNTALNNIYVNNRIIVF